MALPVLTGPALAADPFAGAGTFHLAVTASRTQGGVTAGSAVTAYKWLLSPERTGDMRTVGDPKDAAAHCVPAVSSSPLLTDGPQAGVADPAATCEWPSVRATDGAVRVTASGDQSDFANGSLAAQLPAGRYLISVQAPNFRLDGAHIDITAGGDTAVRVTLDPYPIPLGTVRFRVFEDTVPVDGTYEVGAENTLSGFHAHLADVLGEVTDDWFGNPLCTVYQKAVVDANDKAILDAAGNTSPLVANGAPVPANQLTANDPLYLGDDGKPVIVKSPGCYSDSHGDVAMPNMGQDRYTITVVPPTGQDWIQTTTLEGAHDWDVWTQQNDTGLDTEMTVGGENQPAIDMGFVRATAFAGSASGSVRGRLRMLDTYIPGVGGVQAHGNGTYGGKFWPEAVKDGLVSLSDLNNGDRMVATKRANPDGTFTIPNVPDGDYQLTYWDERQDAIIDSQNVSVVGGAATDVGDLGLIDWWTNVYGHVFIDTNGDGKRQAGEQGVPGFAVTLKGRDNTLNIEGGLNLDTTDDTGAYHLNEGYPLGRWIVEEFFNTRYKTTGVTVQADNDPQEHTYLGPGVDLSLLPLISERGRVDIGVQPYGRNADGSFENGGIVGTVTYDSTRNELNPRYAVAEDYQPSVPDMNMHLYAPAACALPYDGTADGSSCTEDVTSPLDGYVVNADGSVRKGPQLNLPYTTERYTPPTGCEPRDVDGNLLSYAKQLAVPATADGSAPNATCVESPMTGWAVAPSDATDGAFGQTVNGNYGFGDTDRNQYDVGSAQNPAPNHDLPLWAPLDCSTAHVGEHTAAGDSSYAADCASRRAAHFTDNYDNQPLAGGNDYLVSVDIPKDALGRPQYKVTDENSVNVFDGVGYAAQGNFPWTKPYPAPDATPADQALPPADPPTQQANDPSFPPCVGPVRTVSTQTGAEGGPSAAFVGVGGSPWAGQQRPSCDTKLVTLRNAQSVAPTFNVYTDVALPTHFWGLVINDLGLSNDPRSASYGEAEPLPNVPVGFYDWKGTLDDTVHTDPNGFYEALEPSTDTFNCPLPAGPCPGMYHLVGNDPGPSNALNADYNPRYRTIATNFQAWPGTFTATDLAPTQVAVVTVVPGQKQATPVNCDVPATQPMLLAVDKPYVRTSASNKTVTVKGYGFSGSGTLTAVAADGTATNLSTTSWADQQVSFNAGALAPGVYSLSVRRSDGAKTTSGITFRLVGGGYNPQIITVNAPTPDPAAMRNYTNSSPGVDPRYIVQTALDLAMTREGNGDPVVVVYPNAAGATNTRGEYLETIILGGRIELQGVGPGGFTPDRTWVPGTILDGRGFSGDNDQGTHWLNELALPAYANHIQADVPVSDGATVTVLARAGTTSWTNGRHAVIDGLQITGGTQNDITGNLNSIGGVSTGIPAGNVVTQGGGIYVHGGAHYLTVTNNVIVGNAGSYAGGIRLGTPYSQGYLGPNLTPANYRLRYALLRLAALQATPGQSQLLATHNDHVLIANNRIRDNGGTNLAGGVGLFAGSDAYRVTDNDLCGNFSAEYGGAVSAFGLSPNGRIDHNRIWFNESYDEGGAVMVAGEMPPPGLVTSNTGFASLGSGPATITNNLVAENVANDDGGGLRLLQAGAYPIHVIDNALVENISAHEGGGIALDDATDVRFVNNTVAKNLTTATALTVIATGKASASAAGLTTGKVSAELQYALNSSLGGYSKPLMVNDTFWDNRAGWFDSTTGTVVGISSSDANYWDVADLDQAQLPGSSGVLTSSNSAFQSTTQGSTQYLQNGTTDGNTTLTSDPFFHSHDVGVWIQTWRNMPTFRDATIVSENVPPSLTGNYHAATGSPLVSAGASTAGSPNEVPLRDLLDAVWGSSRPNIGAYTTQAP